jgi:acetylornithine deacetylase/succinyl-diaminopimelate desuccinylase-like protein
MPAQKSDLTVSSPRNLAGWLAALIAAGIPVAAAADDAALAARAYREANDARILTDFGEFLKLPNVASNLADMAANADWIEAYLGQRGFETRRWEAGGAPYVYGERRVAGAAKTLLIYAHFDGQPVAPEEWASPPWTPTLRTDLVVNGGEVVPWKRVQTAIDPRWRVFARSAGDDKAPVIALAAAVDALDAAGIEPSVNIKVILDGEEEAGSPTLDRILSAHAGDLEADLMLFCDGPMHQSRRRQLVFGVRGSMTVDLTAYGAQRPLHSGHYGNWAPNPNDTLIRLLAGMKDDEGRITIPGYGDAVRPVTPAEQAAIDAMPRIESGLAKELGLGRTEGGGDRLETLVMRPAIVVKGLSGGGVGAESSNVIRPSATASLNLRLVPDQTPDIIRPVLEKYLAEQGFHIVHADPDRDTLLAHERVLKVDWRPGAYRGFRSDLGGEEARRLVAVLDGIGGEPTLLTPTMGGSLPIYLFETALDLPIVLLPVANHDNNQHGRNENLRLQNLWDAIEVYAAVLANYGR